MTNQYSSRHWQRLAQKMVWSWSDDRSEEMKAAVVARHRTAVKRQRLGIVTGVTLLLLAGVWPAMHYFSQTRTFLAPDIAAPSGVHAPVASTHGGSSAATATTAVAGQGAVVAVSPRAYPLTPGTRFAVEEEADISTYRISKGSVRFETGPDVTRKLLVHVGALTIEDIGTIFTVETLPDDQVLVVVTEGRVKVTWPQGNAELKEGTDGTFPSSPQMSPMVSESQRLPDDNKASRCVDWRIAAKQGQNRTALRLIDEDPGRVQNQVPDLLLAADVMRLTGNPERAVPYLNRVVRQFPGDSRRAAAAFTLGRVLLNELNQPAAAAGMFALAQEKRSPLVEEAIAREAEAWYRAGDSRKCRTKAQQYLEKYPNGARAELVRAICNDSP